MRITLDTNVLFYALDRKSPAKQSIANDILHRGERIAMILLAQVLGEFVNAVRRKNAPGYDEAIALVETWPTLFPIISTHAYHVAAAARKSARYQLQFWDSLILEIARSENVGVLLTEDLQDGATIDGVTILNPFNDKNTAVLDRLLTA